MTDGSSISQDCCWSSFSLGLFGQKGSFQLCQLCQLCQQLCMYMATVAGAERRREWVVHFFGSSPLLLRRLVVCFRPKVFGGHLPPRAPARHAPGVCRRIRVLHGSTNRGAIDAYDRTLTFDEKGTLSRTWHRHQVHLGK